MIFSEVMQETAPISELRKSGVIWPTLFGLFFRQFGYGKQVTPKRLPFGADIIGQEAGTVTIAAGVKCHV
jgi:hypothetical protein